MWIKKKIRFQVTEKKRKSKKANYLYAERYLVKHITSFQKVFNQIWNSTHSVMH